MKRLGALLLSVAMVLGAIALRRALRDDNARDSDAPEHRRSIICDNVLEAACRALSGVDVRSERPAVTAERLATGGSLDADAWVVASPWVTIAGFGPAQPLLETSAPIAHTSVAAVLRRAPELTSCHTWQCLAEPGRRVAHDSVDTTSGLAGIGALVAGHLHDGDRPRTDFARNDIDEDDGFDQWLNEVEHSANLVSRGAPVIRQIQTTGVFDVALGLGVDASGVNPQAVDAVVPPDGPTVAVVIAGNPDAVPLEQLRAALTRAGWRAGRGTRDFNPGALATLRERVKDVTR